ncbi:MAG: secondary thiamine-phosphate synthase enzyme YjbQ [Candidatus Saelkia tenebricola]|nr:secondary thiamine-phosphate synthase enzyme YjbQ [Candidatus Saelkia tenebricola]
MKIELKTNKRTELIDITSSINSLIKENGMENGVCTVYIPHTTAGILVNENYDPSVKHDILNWLNSRVTENGNYLHSEGNSDAHIKSMLLGNSMVLVIDDNKLLLGPWQGVLFAEFDGPRNREIWIKLSKS